MSLVVASGLHGLGPGIVVGAEIDLALEIVEWSGHIRLMGHPQRDYHYRLRKYARRRGVIWRWFIFEGESGPVETGIVLEPDRDKAEAAAKEAIERLRRMPPHIRVERSVGSAAHNDAAGQPGS
jgi:hypothetical protein